MLHVWNIEWDLAINLYSCLCFFIASFSAVFITLQLALINSKLTWIQRYLIDVENECVYFCGFIITKTKQKRILRPYRLPKLSCKHICMFQNIECKSFYPRPVLAFRYPDNKVHAANMGPTWVLSAPCWPHESCYQGIVIACVCLSLCVCMSKNPWKLFIVQARTTKFRQKTQNTLVKIPFVLGLISLDLQGQI